MAKKKVGYNKHLSLNNTLILLRVLSIVSLLIITLLTISFAIRSTKAILLIHSEEAALLADESQVVSYLADINDMSIPSAKELITQLGNPLVLSGIYVILPTCILFVAFFFILYSSVILFYFTAGIKNRKDILDRRKYNMLQTIRTLTYIAIGVLLFLFGIEFFFIGLALVPFIELALYMYDSMIDMEEKGLKK